MAYVDKLAATYRVSSDIKATTDELESKIGKERLEKIEARLGYCLVSFGFNSSLIKLILFVSINISSFDLFVILI